MSIPSSVWTGCKYTGQSGDLSYGVSLQDESFDNACSHLVVHDNDGSYSIEAAVALTSGNFTYSLGGAFEDADDWETTPSSTLTLLTSVVHGLSVLNTTLPISKLQTMQRLIHGWSWPTTLTVTVVQ